MASLHCSVHHFPHPHRTETWNINILLYKEAPFVVHNHIRQCQASHPSHVGDVVWWWWCGWEWEGVEWMTVKLPLYTGYQSTDLIELVNLLVPVPALLRRAPSF